MRSPVLSLMLIASALASAQISRSPVDRPLRPIDGQLLSAVSSGKVETVRALLAKGANPNANLYEGSVPLNNVGGSPTQMLAIAKLLVAKGAKVNPPQVGQGYTPLINAVHRAAEPIGLVRFLLAKGANPNAAIDMGMTPLHFAAQWGMVASAKELIAHGARVNARTNDRDTIRTDSPNLDSFSRRRAEEAKEFTDHTFEPGYRKSGETPLFSVAQRWNPVMVDLLLKAGANLKTTDVNGWTMLHDAAKRGNAAAVQGLLARGADPNAASVGGFRPLHLALRAGYGFPEPNVVRLLVAKGANPKLTNKAGQTPLDLLRADSAWLVGNPSGNPERAFPAAMLPQLQAAVDAAAKALDPQAAPIVLQLPKPNPAGQRYAPLEVMNDMAERTVRIENGEALLEFVLPPLTEGNATLTVKEITLEEFDTITPLPLVVRRTKGKPDRLAFRFPIGAARGGAVNMAATQEGPGNESSMMGTTGSDGATDATHPQPSFQYNPGVAVGHFVPDRTMEFEILSVRRNGKSLPGFAGKVFRVPSDQYVPIPGLKSGDANLPSSPRVTIAFRFRYLPNVKWRTGSMAL